jgi:hypothetical protein
VVRGELGEPRLLGLVREGNPIYAWPYERRHVWRTERLPFPGVVVARLTRLAGREQRKSAAPVGAALIVDSDGS